MTDIWRALERIPLSMAEAVRPSLDRATILGYHRFLDAMVHYTRGSGERLLHAARHAPDEALRDFFEQLAREEAGHYRLAEADLAAFGLAPSQTPPPSVERFHDGWIQSRWPSAWLGALYALESVGGHLAQSAAQNLGRLGLSRDKARFVMVHLEADAEHAKATARHIRHFTDVDGVRLLDAATSAASFWVELHKQALDEPGA
jgi:pyrroloquinoline quinone (PQQ) biosynthesis protein C